MLALPHELIEVILDCTIRNDNDAVLVFQSCRLLRDLVGDRQRRQQPFPRRLFFNLTSKNLPIITDSIIEWYSNCLPEWSDNALILFQIGQRCSYRLISKFGFSLSSSQVTLGAARSGRLELLKKIWSDVDFYELKQEDDDNNLLELAITGGHFETVQWLREVKKYPFNVSYSLPQAASTGNLEMVKWIINQTELETFGSIQGVVAAAAGSGNLELVKWLIGSGFPIDESTQAKAARYGHLDIMKWLLENNIQKLTHTETVSAGAAGHLNILKWLSENNCIWHAYAMTMAAREGYFDIVVWLWENGCPIHPSAMRFAADKGDLGVMQYLFSKGCSIKDPHVLYYAVEHGDLEMMEWIHQNEDPGIQYLNLRLMNNAIRTGKLNIVIWVFQKYPSTSSDLTDAAYTAALNDHLHILIWLSENGFDLECDNLYSILKLNEDKHREILEWFWMQTGGKVFAEMNICG